MRDSLLHLHKLTDNVPPLYLSENIGVALKMLALIRYSFALQVLPDIIRRAKTVFCDLGSLTPVVAELEAFQSALQQGRVRSLNRYSHQQRWVKSPSELNLMREAASITCKVRIYSS